MKRTVPALVGGLLALSACAASGGTPPPSSVPSGDGTIEHPGGSEAVLIVEYAGGMMPVDFAVTQLPAFVMLGDGRVIVQGMQTLEFPGPALPPLMERTLTPAGVQKVLEAVEDTNLFGEDVELRGAQAFVADAADTIFSLRAGGREVRLTVYALGMVTPGMELPPGMSAAEVNAHQALSQLNDALLNLDAWLTADDWEAEGWQPYEPDAFRLYVRDATGEPVDGGGLPEQVREWPTDDDPKAFGEEVVTFGNGTRCGVVEGDAGRAWLVELSASTQMTRWTTDGSNRLSVAPRPLLPHEERACPSV